VLELPLILLVQKKSKLAHAKELWERDKIEETLISFPRTDPVHAYFQRGLERLGVEWLCGIEVTSDRFDLVVQFKCVLLLSGRKPCCKTAVT